VVAHFVGRLHAVCGRMRQRLETVGGVDAVTEDLLIEVTNDLEEQAWMMQAQENAPA